MTKNKRKRRPAGSRRGGQFAPGVRPVDTPSGSSLQLPSEINVLSTSIKNRDGIWHHEQTVGNSPLTIKMLDGGEKAMMVYSKLLADSLCRRLNSGDILRSNVDEIIKTLNTRSFTIYPKTGTPASQRLESNIGALWCMVDIRAATKDESITKNMKQDDEEAARLFQNMPGSKAFGIANSNAFQSLMSFLFEKQKSHGSWKLPAPYNLARRYDIFKDTTLAGRLYDSLWKAYEVPDTPYSTSPAATCLIIMSKWHELKHSPEEFRDWLYHTPLVPLKDIDGITQYIRIIWKGLKEDKEYAQEVLTQIAILADETRHYEYWEGIKESLQYLNFYELSEDADDIKMKPFTLKARDAISKGLTDEAKNELSMF